MPKLLERLPERGIAQHRRQVDLPTPGLVGLLNGVGEHPAMDDPIGLRETGRGRLRSPCTCPPRPAVGRCSRPYPVARDELLQLAYRARRPSPFGAADLLAADVAEARSTRFSSTTFLLCPTPFGTATASVTVVTSHTKTWSRRTARVPPLGQDSRASVGQGASPQ